MRRRLILSSVLPLLLLITTLSYGADAIEGPDLVARIWRHSPANELCSGEFISVAQPLNDLGPNEYVRLDGGPTGFFGGLYPEGLNERPEAHEIAGLDIAESIGPLNANGEPDDQGKFAMLSIGMSNTQAHFEGFIEEADDYSLINDRLVLVNGAQSGVSSEEWADPGNIAWAQLENILQSSPVTRDQVQVVWILLARTNHNAFPHNSNRLQSELESVVQILHSRFPNLKLAYLSSRVRAYSYWTGLSPEPTAFETGFSVKWMIEKQIDGDPGLNFNPDLGPVEAPYLAWGPYLWVDGINPRSDGRIWLPEDLIYDCVHPSDNGVDKVADQLMHFFINDSTTDPWFNRTIYYNYLPVVNLN